MNECSPFLSVIIASTRPLKEVPLCLTAITEQCRNRQAEIFFVESCDKGYSDAMSARFPGITFFRLPPKTTFPRLLGKAIAQASGEVIAITDAACRIDHHWVTSILKTHEMPNPVIGGAVEPDGLTSVTDWAAYFYDYGQFMLPLPEGVAEEMPGNNVSLKRWAVSMGMELVGEEFWKSSWIQRIRLEGIELYSTPSILVYYKKSFHFLEYMVNRFHNGRCFAGMRIERIDGIGRLTYLAGSPLLPFLLFARRVKAVMLKHRYRSRLLVCIPTIFLAAMSWAVGEFFGYLGGTADSCRHVR